MGDVSQADAYARRVEALVQEARGSPNPCGAQSYQIYGNLWESDADAARGLVFEAHGQYAEAEAAYRRTEAFSRAAVMDLPKFDVSAASRNSCCRPPITLSLRSRAKWPSKGD